MGRLPQSVIVSAALLFLCAGLCWGAATQPQQTALSPAPAFAATSPDPVLFRYKFKQGQTAATKLAMQIANRMQMGENNKVTVHVTIDMDAQYTVRSVDGNGDAWAVLTITRMKMRSDGPEAVAFDSAQNQPAGNPHLQALQAMLNTPIPVKVSALGKVLDMDRDPIDQAIRRAGIAANVFDANKTADDIVKGSFVQLSASPVRRGDIYTAGTIVQKTEGLGEMALDARFKVLSVSGDGKQALLQPMGDFMLKPGNEAGPVRINLSKASVNGWILFDLEKGFISRSEVLVTMEMEASEGANAMHLATDTIARCSNRLRD